MQAQLETKECRIQHMRIPLEEKIQICIETDSQCKNACYHSRLLKLAIPGVKMKQEAQFSIKCNNVLKSQVIKEESLSKGLKDHFLPKFKEDNNRKDTSDIIAKKVVQLSKVSD